MSGVNADAHRGTALSMISLQQAGRWAGGGLLLAGLVLLPSPVRHRDPDATPPRRELSGEADPPRSAEARGEAKWASPEGESAQAAGAPDSPDREGGRAAASLDPDRLVKEGDGAAPVAASLPPVLTPRRPSAPDLPRFGEAELAQVRDAVAAYRRGDLAVGDAMRARVRSAAAGLLLDWMAVRTPGLGIDSGRVLAFGRAYPDWPGQSWLRRRTEELLVAERKPGPVLRAFFGAEKPQSAAGKLALALALRADGLGTEATALVRDAWRHDTFGRDLELRFLDAFKDALGTADHRFRMERFLHKENWDSARRAAEYAGAGYDALVKARAAVDGRSAIAAKLLDAVPAPLKADTSYLFSRAQFLRRAEKTQEAAKLVLGVTKDPAVLADGDEWWVERRLISRKLLDEGDPKAAYAVATGHAAVSNERRIEAEFHAGWLALRFLGEPDVARRHFDAAAAIAGTPISLARAGYWQGRAAEATGAGAEALVAYAAAARHPTTYYGQLAAAKLGPASVSLRPVSDPAGAERRAAAASPLVGAVALAYGAGLRDLGTALAVELGRHGRNQAQLETVADLLAEQRDPRALLAMGKTASQRGLPLDEAAFPVVGVPSFEPLGHRVEKAMVHAIARQESAFDPAALSTAGARGLMQMMPGTAQMTAKKAGLAYEPARLGDATYNARLGAAHLGDLMADWRGSYILTFASYNAGPGNVRKWIQAYGDPRLPDVDAVDWVERIPFSETRNYVQRVMENLQVYRKRLDEQSTMLIDSDLKRGGAAKP
jgi:soluble lytic murein transglycosylase